MKIVIATDSFKDCCTALEACQAIGQGIKDACPQVDVVMQPLADGGEGTLTVLQHCLQGQWMNCQVQGPLASSLVEAQYLWIPSSHTAIVEMAQASGLQYLSEEQRNPMQTSSYGTGQLMQAALEQGAQRILLAVGGSATVDLGIGMAAALGWRFLDEHHQEIKPMGQSLLKIEQIVRPLQIPEVEVLVLCDVSNPLLGQDGAAKIYGPQKGASRSDVVLLEVGLTHMAGLIRREFNLEFDGVPGGGAAGGLAAGAAFFLNATLVPGIETIMHETGLMEQLEDAEVVITGEGRLDAQSFHGKVVGGIARVCSELDRKVVVMAGQVHLSQEQCRSQGIDQALGCTPPDVSIKQALQQGPEYLKQCARQWAQENVSA